jgi:hypothetical protein
VIHYFIVGLNYQGTPFELNGCNNDAKFYEYQALFLDAEYVVYNYISRNELIMGLYSLMFNLKKSDTVYFCFAGHGTKIKVDTGIKYKGIQNAIVLHDGINYETVYIEEIKTIVRGMKCECFCIFDCSFGDERRMVFRENNDKIVRRNIKYEDLGLETDEVRPSYAAPHAKNETFIFASRDKYPAIELEGNGAFTLFLKRKWKEIRTLNGLFMQMLFALQKYQQQPYIEYSSKSKKNTKIFKLNEIDTIINQSNRRGTTKDKRTISQYESGKTGFRQY